MRLSGGPLSGTQDHPIQLFALEGPGRPKPLLESLSSLVYTCYCSLRFSCALKSLLMIPDSKGHLDIWRLDYPFPRTHPHPKVHDLGSFWLLLHNFHLGMSLSPLPILITRFQASALTPAGKTFLGTLHMSVMTLLSSSFD